MKVLYETLNQASLLDSKHLYQCGNREFSRLEPRRSNPLDRYQLPEDQWQIPSSKPMLSDHHVSEVQGVHKQSYHENREQTNKKQHDSHGYRNTSNDDEPVEHYLQVDPRCYVRQKSNVSGTTHRRSEVPRLEKGHSINVDTRPSPTSSSLSPYRQSSFDVTLACRPHNQQPSPSSLTVSSQQEIYFTPRGSNISVAGNTSTNTPPGSQHLSPPTPITSRNSSPIEKKDLTVNLDVSGQTTTIRSSIVQREHEHFRSLEHSSSANNTAVDKQSRSFDAVQLLRPDIHREDVALNRRTKSYEIAEEHQPLPKSLPMSPPPIVIKIPDMRELVQAAQLSQLQKNELDEYQHDSNRKSILAHQIILDNHNNESISRQDLWRLRQSYEFDEQQQQLDRTSPEDLSPDLFTSTSIDSAGAMTNHHTTNKTNNDDLSKYEYRRKSSSNLLLPPPEVRRQALRRTFEKRRRCINQSNARREQQFIDNQTGLDDEYNISNQSSTIKSNEFSSLLNHFNSKSENSSFDRSLETDFDMQSDTSSRGVNDQFTSIESSGNENAQPDLNHHLFINQQQSARQDDSGYKSLESQKSQNQTFSLDWMSTDGGETVIYIDQSRKQQSLDLRDLEEDLTEQQQLLNNNRFHRSFQETSPTVHRPILPYSNITQQRSLSTNILPDDRYTLNLLLTPNTNLLTDQPDTSSSSLSFVRTASKKRRAFGKDKRHAETNATLPYLTTTDVPTIHQINGINTKQTSSTATSTLQVRHTNICRSKSDEADILDFSTIESTSYSNESNNNIHLSSSTDGVLHSTSISNPIRLNNNGDGRHLFQRSPSSTTQPVALSPQIIAFRSKRGSVSFDNQASPINFLTSNPTTTSPTYSVLSPSVTKPRLKFSMLRDTTTTSLTSKTSINSMPLANDFTIDEKTNRIIKEFLMQDNNNIRNHLSFEQSTKHPQCQIRQNTFDETILTNNNHQIQRQQSRTPFIKQRQHSFIQTNIPQQTLPHYPSLHLTDNNQQKSHSQSPSSTLIQQSVAVLRRDNSVPVSSPSIIVTGYDSGS